MLFIQWQCLEVPVEVEADPEVDLAALGLAAIAFFFLLNLNNVPK
jgi:hypothetical protein